MKWLTIKDVLWAHLQFGQLDRNQVRLAMGPNWPLEWDDVEPGIGIFSN